MPGITSFCSKYKHAPLASFKGTPEEEPMALKSHEFIHTIEVTLQKVVKFTAAPESVSLLDAMPVLTLTFNSHGNISSRSDSLIDANRTRVFLQAFGQLVQFSCKLRTFPQVKATLWAAFAATMRKNYLE